MNSPIRSLSEAVDRAAQSQRAAREAGAEASRRASEEVRSERPTREGETGDGSTAVQSPTG